MPEKLIGDVASGWPGVIAGLASGMGSLAVFMWRTRRNDSRQDEVANQFGEMVEIMRGLAQAQQDRADQQSRRADDFAKTRNYTNIMSAATYATSTVPKFKAEGQYAVEARDATWAKCYEILAAVEAGSRPIPTLDELLAELPVLTWPN